MKATVREGRSMGSPLRLTLPGERESEAGTAWAVVVAAFEAADHALSRFDAASPLSRLNARAGQPTTVSPLL
ncbi:MAG: hypothetical protein IT341_03310, partial [Chloroflexi bacterium]|nr:hypothetical protein [Chloroflexota bacterium]